MDGIIWLYLAQVVALVVLSVVVIGLRRRRLEPDLTSRHCPHCETPMSMRRVSFFKSYFLLGAWECPHCGARTGGGISISRSGSL
jgi:ribosomal protein L37AE/L43A